MSPRKPRLTLAEYELLCEMRKTYELLCEMRETYEHGGIRPGGGLYQVEQLACDTMDGWKRDTDPETQGLIRKRLIHQYRHDGEPVVCRGDGGERIRLDCPYTWHLTERGARLVAPEAFAETPLS